MISREEVLMGRDAEFPLDEVLEQNLQKLLVALNKFRSLYGIPLHVSSGYRPDYYNKKAGGVIHSLHRVCLACDFSDPKGEIDQWITMNEHVLEDCGLWREAQASTVGWVHLQVEPYKSYRPGGPRSFKP